MRKKRYWRMEAAVVTLGLILLVVITFPNFLRQQKRGLARRMQQDLHAIAEAVSAYYLDNNQLPHEYYSFKHASKAPKFELIGGRDHYTNAPYQLAQWHQLVEPLMQGGYLKKAPKSFTRLLQLPNHENTLIVTHVQERDLTYSGWRLKTINWSIAAECPALDEEKRMKKSLSSPRISTINTITPSGNVQIITREFELNPRSFKPGSTLDWTVPLIDLSICYDPKEEPDAGGYIYADTCGNRIP